MAFLKSLILLTILLQQCNFVFGRYDWTGYCDDTKDAKYYRNKGEVSGKSKPINLHNWGGNVVFSTQDIQYPRTVSEVQQIVKGAKKVRMFGSRHSFNTIADSKYTMLSTLGLNNIIAINTSVPSVRVQGGITYTDLITTIQNTGFALPKLAALAEISVAGAIQTGTHGSGLSTGNLATQVRSLQMVLANGNVVNFTVGDPQLKAVTVGLGVFGVVTEVELKLVPTYNLKTFTFVNLPVDAAYKNFDEIMNLGYTVHYLSFSPNNSVFDVVIVNVRSDNATNLNRVGKLTNLFGASLASVSNDTVWYAAQLVLPLGLSGADGNEIQSEFFVPFANAPAAIKAVRALYPKIKPFLTAFVIRTMENDDFWLSQASNQGSNSTGGRQAHVAIHFSWVMNVTAVESVLPAIERILLPFGARPHWAKFYTKEMAEGIQKNYPKLEAFKALANKMDPTGKFRNEYIDEFVFGKCSDSNPNPPGGGHSALSSSSSSSSSSSAEHESNSEEGY